jgi:glycosyltransferase involved in cell wall biosynthesis
MLSLDEVRLLSEHEFFALDYSAIFEPPLANAACRQVTAIAQTYNEMTFLEESIASAAYTLGEVIVVDHGSTDGTADVIRRVQRHFPNVRYHHADRTKYSQGMVKELAVSLATTPWVMRWDSDFIAYNRSIMSSLCNKIASDASLQGPATVIHYAMPMVDGDLFHVRPNGFRPEAEPYLFRRGAVGFGQHGHFDDWPRFNGTAGRSHNLQGRLLGSLSNAFILHLASFKPAEAVARRSQMTHYQVYVRQAIRRKVPVLDFWQWAELQHRGMDPAVTEPGSSGSAASVQVYRDRQVLALCRRSMKLAYFDTNRWPHTAFINTLLERKLLLFFIVPASNQHNTHSDRVQEYNVYLPGCPLTGAITRSHHYPGLAALIDSLPNTTTAATAAMAATTAGEP